MKKTYINTVSAATLLITSFILPCFAQTPPAVATTAAEQSLPAPKPSGAELIKLLSQGGYSIFFRHGLSDYTKVDAENIDFKNCNTQRPLLEGGRDQAVFIGQAIKKFHIPVGEVWVSPFCRTKETAELAIGKKYTVLDELEFSIGEKKDTRHRKGQFTKQLMSTPPQTGTNNFIIAHTGNLKEAFNIFPRPEGVMVIFKHLPDGGIEHIGEVAPADWPEMPEHLQYSEENERLEKEYRARNKNQ